MIIFYRCCFLCPCILYMITEILHIVTVMCMVHSRNDKNTVVKRMLLIKDRSLNFLHMRKNKTRLSHSQLLCHSTHTGNNALTEMH